MQLASEGKVVWGLPNLKQPIRKPSVIVQESVMKGSKNSGGIEKALMLQLYGGKNKEKWIEM